MCSAKGRLPETIRDDRRVGHRSKVLELLMLLLLPLVMQNRELLRPYEMTIGSRCEQRIKSQQITTNNDSAERRTQRGEGQEARDRAKWQEASNAENKSKSSTKRNKQRTTHNNKKQRTTKNTTKQNKERTAHTTAQNTERRERAGQRKQRTKQRTTKRTTKKQKPCMFKHCRSRPGCSQDVFEKRCGV